MEMAKKATEKSTSDKKSTKNKSIVSVKKTTDKNLAPINEKAKKTTAKTKNTPIKKSLKTTTKESKAVDEKQIKKSTKLTLQKSTKTVVEKTIPLNNNTMPDKKPSVKLPVKSILISQPKPELGKSPYIDLAQQFKIKLDWRPFTHVEGIKAADFRKQKIYIEQYSCVIFTSKIAIEQYFRICEELRVKINEDNKYFCTSEAIALYLQKYIQYRKRKVFYGDGKLPKLMEVILKHKEDGKFLLPCSDVSDKALAEALLKNSIPYNEAVIYKTVASDLSDLSDVKYDMLVFFNASAIDSLYTNFPKFSQDNTRLAIFGNTTSDAVKSHQLTINVFAPTPENPSLVDAIKKYIIEANKRK